MSAFSELVARSLVHFLWEGAVLGLLAALLLRAMRRSLPQVRYTAACAFLLAMAIAPAVTLAALDAPGQAARVPAVTGGAAEIIDVLPALPGGPRESWPAVVFTAWLAGVGLFSLRAAGGWLWAVRRLRAGRSDPGTDVRDAAGRIAARLGVERPVRVFESATSAVPVTYGAIRPVILLPASALTGLDPSHLEAILAHELAHVARHDFVVNCLQTAVETVLFYHPAVWWLSRTIRQEREMCCDSMAAELSGDRVRYSRALLAMEELRHAPEPALAVSGGDLRARVERLLVPNAPDRSSFLSAMLVLAAVLTGGALVTLKAQQPAPGTAWDKWLKEDVAYIINPDELEAFRRIHTDEERRYFVEQFWNVRGGEPAKEEHYRRIAYVNSRYAGDRPGWMTDRGRIYIAYGPPAEIESHPEFLESWRYSDGRQYDFFGPDYKLQPRPGFPMARIGVDRMPETVRPALRALLNKYIGKPMSTELMQAIQDDVRSIEPHTGFIWRTHRETAETSVELFPSPGPGDRGELRPSTLRFQVAAVPRTEAATAIEELTRRGFRSWLEPSTQNSGVFRVLVAAGPDPESVRRKLTDAGWKSTIGPY